MKFDRFDIISLVAAAALSVAASGVVIYARDDTPSVRPAASRVQPAPSAPSADLGPKLAAVRSLIDTGQPKEAVKALSELARSNPAEPEVHAMLGEAGARMQDHPMSMTEYRTAVQMDPEYVEKKSGKFIGNRIKAEVKDAMSYAKAILASKPDDSVAKATLKDAYYLERMLAGGCE